VWNLGIFGNFTLGEQFDNLRCGFSMEPDKINMTYEPLYERFEVLAAGGTVSA